MVLSAATSPSRFVAGTLCCALAATAVAAAAETQEQKRSYRFPRGEAAAVLAQFATESGRPILFMMDVVRGEHTNALAGNFTPREALDRLLAGTGMVAVYDPKSGGFIINRRPAEVSAGSKRGTESESRPSASSKTIDPSQAMKISKPTDQSAISGKTVQRTGPLALLAAWIGLALGPAQAADVSATFGAIHGRVQNAVTGQYLNNARVTITGTDQVVFTDAFGVYRINNVPSGRVVLEVFYTDLDVRAVPVEVAPGGMTQQDVDLTSAARYGAGGVVKLDAFVVTSDRETSAEAIAINEQRFAPNIKSVVSTDTMGVLVAGHGQSGEFMKFVPGVTTTDRGPGVARIAVRGIGSEMTNYSTDGQQIVNASNGNSRRFSLGEVSLFDISRVEVTKVPTPAMAADSLGGSVNMIRKSAFEQKDNELRVGFTLFANSHELALDKQPDSARDRLSYKIVPGVDLHYSRVFGKNFGLVFTGTNGKRYAKSIFSRRNYSGTVAGATFDRPFLQSYLLYDAPSDLLSTTFGVKADWRITPQSVLSVGGSSNMLTTKNGAVQFTPSAGTNSVPTPATGVPFSYGPDFTIGATGRGSAATASANQTTESELASGDVRYRYDDGTWRLEAGLNTSSSFWIRDNFKHGHFQNMNNTVNVPIRISFLKINPVKPGRIVAYDNSDREVDLYNINNYLATTATNVPLDTQADMTSGFVNIRRQVDFLPGLTAIQFGGAYKRRELDTRTRTQTFTYNGPDGNPATTADQGAAPLAMQVYVNQDSGFGFKGLPWMSSTRAFAAWKANPALFSQTPAQIVSEETTRLNGSTYLLEAVSAGYLQVEGSVLQNRLKILAGVRYEKTENRGLGALADPNAVWVRNADGSFARNAQGARIRRGDAGAVGSIEELRLVRTERAARSHKTYDGYYPSLHFTYLFKENFLGRLAYAKTYGRPDFAEITPQTTIQENDLFGTGGTGLPGILNARNPSLKPWTADNFDLSLEYYTEQGGMFTAGLFTKDIKNFFGQATRIATAEDLRAVGLDESYVGWQLTSNVNVAGAKIEGGELSARQSLRAVKTLGTWGNALTVFANFTRLKLQGSQGANFESFVPLIVNWGVAYNRKKLGFNLRWNHHGKDKRAPAPTAGADGYDYFKPRTTMDLSFSFQITRRISLVGNMNNVFFKERNWLKVGSQTPDYAKQYQVQDHGAPIALGIRGSF